MTSSQSDDKTYLRDGVYVGFNVPFVNGKEFPHPYIEVVQSGRRTVYEYGPKNGLGSDLLEMRDVYKDDERTAGALFKISPPQGCSEAQFISRAHAAGKALDDFLAPKHIAYMERNDQPSGVTCDTGALAILENLGLRGRQFLAMTNAISTANPGVTVLDDVGALTPYAGKDSEVRTVTPYKAGRMTIDHQVIYHDRLSEMSWVIFEHIGYAPGIERPGTGKASYQALELEKGQWHETSPQIPHETPHPEPGHAPPQNAFASHEYQHESPQYTENRKRSTTATDLQPHEIPAYVARAKAFYNEALRGLGSEWVSPSITVTENGVESNIEYLQPQLGIVVGLNKGYLTQQTRQGLVEYDYSDLLRKTPNPVQFDRDMRYAMQTGMPITLAFQDNCINYAVGQQVALELNRQRDDRGWEHGH